MPNTHIDSQSKYAVRCEWGQDAIQYFYDITDVFIIVDVLSFSTCVDVATSRGAHIYPYKFKDDSALQYSQSKGAVLAGRREENTRFSLSPRSMQSANSGDKIVLPSPNGSLLSTMCAGKTTICGSLRNATAVAKHAIQIGSSITVIPAGERWPNGNIRFALEDAVGAGAVINALGNDLSPEAASMKSLWQSFKNNLRQVLDECTSGNELIVRNFSEDILIAAAYDSSTTVPVFTGEYYRAL